MQLGKLAARTLIGGLFIGHGTQKLMGWFGGSGLEGTDGMMTAINMHPARRNSISAGTTEAVGGALLLAGLGTPVACGALIGVMTTAIRKVHLANGPWSSNGGWEYNAVLIASLVALAEGGPGKVSIDHLRGTERSGTRWGLGALALGLAASTAAIEAGRRPVQDAVADDGTSPFPDTAGDPAND